MIIASRQHCNKPNANALMEASLEKSWKKKADWFLSLPILAALWSHDCKEKWGDVLCFAITSKSRVLQYCYKALNPSPILSSWHFPFLQHILILILIGWTVISVWGKSQTEPVSVDAAPALVFLFLLPLMHQHLSFSHFSSFSPQQTIKSERNLCQCLT